ncbi:hypothetical protein [Streptomyces sp. NPDC004546]|uniref:hypothetical protein n=1 Tax=Streptomyces sp. NPDC004546 TaxID=3154282 RepID=UPI0033A0164C
MSTNTTLSTYDDGDPTPLNVANELDMAARVLSETANASIFDDSDMIRSAVALRMRLRGLAAAVLAERGEGQ